MTKGWKLVSKLGAAAALAAAFLTVACDGATRADEDGSVVSVEVNAPASELEAGTSAQFEAVLRNRKGEPVTGRGVAWSSTDSAVAAVSAVGVRNASRFTSFRFGIPHRYADSVVGLPGFP